MYVINRSGLLSDVADRQSTPVEIDSKEMKLKDYLSINVDVFTMPT